MGPRKRGCESGVTRHFEKGVYLHIGLGSNNVAEYKALIQGLRESKKLLAQSVNVFSDSELLVNQMNGRFRINDQHLRRLSQQAKSLEGKFQKVTYRNQKLIGLVSHQQETLVFVARTSESDYPSLNSICNLG